MPNTALRKQQGWASLETGPWGDSRRAGAAAWVTEKELGTAETGRAGNGPGSHHLNPAANKSLVLIKPFFFPPPGLGDGELLPSVAWRSHAPPVADCPLPPLPAPKRSGGCLPAAAALELLAAVFSIFFAIYGCFQQV